MELRLPEIFSIGYYDSDIALKGVKITKERIAPRFEIELPVKKGGILYIDSEEEHIDTDMLICAKPGQTRHSRMPLKCFAVRIEDGDSEICKALWSLPSFIKTNRYTEYYEIFQTLSERYKLSKDDSFIIYGLLLQLIHLMLEDAEERYKPSFKISQEAMIDTTRYIRENLCDDLTLEKLAQRQGYSPTYFHKLFKSFMNMSLRDYIEEARIERAIMFLEETDYTLSKIAHECGFSSQSYFNYVFKRRMNTSPRKYVKRK